MTNIGNEYGQVLNSVLTTGEGAGLDDLCQGVVQRYRDAGEPQPDAIYVDRDCCSDSGGLPVFCVIMSSFFKMKPVGRSLITNQKYSFFIVL